MLTEGILQVQSGRYSSIFFAKVKLKFVEDPGGEGLDEFGGKPPNPPAFFDVKSWGFPTPPPPQKKNGYSALDCEVRERDIA